MVPRSFDMAGRIRPSDPCDSDSGTAPKENSLVRVGDPPRGHLILSQQIREAEARRGVQDRDSLAACERVIQTAVWQLNHPHAEAPDEVNDTGQGERHHSTRGRPNQGERHHSTQGERHHSNQGDRRVERHHQGQGEPSSCADTGRANNSHNRGERHQHRERAQRHRSRSPVPKARPMCGKIPQIPAVPPAHLLAQRDEQPAAADELDDGEDWLWFLDSPEWQQHEDVHGDKLYKYTGDMSILRGVQVTERPDCYWIRKPK